MNKLLKHIKSPKDLRQLDTEQLSLLAEEIRNFILDVISVKPGHLGASLGVVELSIALHYHFNTPKDLLIWDVGHQSYPHKILTGRQGIFDTLRQLHGISGFPVREESPYDAFGTGHSSTSISAITGMALANKLKGNNNKHIAVIGDASIVSGMALEGLNHLGDTDLDVLIILNDNNIAIDPAVGALQKYFNVLDANAHAFFESLGFYYKGIVDGHDTNVLLDTLKDLDLVKRPKLLHIRTVKGKGFAYAEKDQILWHAPGKFNKETGEIAPVKKPISYANAIGKILHKTFKTYKNTVAITPAMPTGSGLVELMKNYPKRVWDVGIAEQHAVTLGAGLATQGMKPFVVIYSTFLQRAYDQVIHDVAIQNLPVVFLIDRAGITGGDGATHHGYFDIAFLNAIPHITVAAAANAKELEELILLAAVAKTPWAIRYPKGDIKLQTNFLEDTFYGKAKTIKQGNKLAVLSTGHIASEIKKAVEDLDVSWYHFPFIKPLDQETLKNIYKNHEVILTYEEGVTSGGFGSSILQHAAHNNYKGKVVIKGLPDAFIAHGSIQELKRMYNLDAKGIQATIQSLL